MLCFSVTDALLLLGVRTMDESVVEVRIYEMVS